MERAIVGVVGIADIIAIAASFPIRSSAGRCFFVRRLVGDSYPIAIRDDFWGTCFVVVYVF